jgi:AraC-like DNA-binding protein
VTSPTLPSVAPRVGTVVATRAYRIVAVQIPGPLLVVPLVGTKVAHRGERRIECPPGSALVVHDRVAMDVENLPDASGSYTALVLPIPARVRASVYALFEGPLPSTADERITVCPRSALQDALMVLLALPPEAGSLAEDHALAGLAVALVRAGHSRFLAPREPTLADRVRELASAAPAHPWSAADMERALHMSGATLRRRLAEEGTSFRRLLADVRLHHGLLLLQTTRKPLKGVAFESGYRSLASFREQFRARFGCEPSVVRA